MQTAKCPNCGNDIEALSAKDLEDEFNISPNALQHARERGTFPKPWMSFGNRNVWLKSDINEYAERRAQASISRTVTDLRRSLDGLPAADRREALKQLQKELGGR